MRSQENDTTFLVNCKKLKLDHLLSSISEKYRSIPVKHALYKNPTNRLNIQARNRLFIWVGKKIYQDSGDIATKRLENFLDEDLLIRNQKWFRG